jgi:hypothetical protein
MGQMLSQPQSPNPKNDLIRQAVEKIDQNQHTPESPHAYGSGCRQSLNTASSQGHLRSFDSNEENYPETVGDYSGFRSRGRSGDDQLHQQDDYQDSCRQHLGNSTEYPLSDVCHRQMQLIFEEFDPLAARPHENRISPEEPNFRSIAQQISSGKRHINRRTAD